jgi:hypothetical protein
MFVAGYFGGYRAWVSSLPHAVDYDWSTATEKAPNPSGGMLYRYGNVVYRIDNNGIGTRMQYADVSEAKAVMNWANKR